MIEKEFDPWAMKCTYTKLWYPSRKRKLAKLGLLHSRTNKYYASYDNIKATLSDVNYSLSPRGASHLCAACAGIQVVLGICKCYNFQNR